MSEAKVLTAKQQRKTLSNFKKKKKKAPVRNVFGHPRKEYWPVVSAEDEHIILNCMRKLIRTHRANKDSSKTKTSTVKTLSACSSKQSVTSQQNDILSNELIIGLRKVIVEVQEGNLGCLLLAKEVDPPSLGYMIGNLAASHNIPFVAVSNLKSCLEELLGFKSWCIGFLVSSKHFNPICDKVKSFVNNFQETLSQKETSLCTQDAKESDSKCIFEKKAKNISDLHLYRADKSKRMFVPGSGTSQDNLEPSFLSFSKDTTGHSAHREVPIQSLNKSGIIRKLTFDSQKAKQPLRYFDKVQLLPLQVKKFQQNPNKKKWKISKNRSLENGQQAA